MVFGLLAAMMSGACLPLLFILFGDITNAFVYNGIVSTINDETLPDLIEQYPAIPENSTVDE